MSEPDRDLVVSQRYRELAPEEPPSTLDAGILAAARDESDLRPAPLVAPTGRRRWYVPLAAAAVIVLSVVVTLHLQGERPDAELALRDEAPPSPGPASATQPPAPKPLADAAREAPEKAAGVLHRTPEKPRAPRQASRAAPAPQATEALPSAERGEAPASGAEATAKLAQDVLAPEEWLARIARMRRDGRHAEADEAYAAFRRRYPEFRIPEALRDQVLPR